MKETGTACFPHCSKPPTDEQVVSPALPGVCVQKLPQLMHQDHGTDATGSSACCCYTSARVPNHRTADILPVMPCLGLLYRRECACLKPSMFPTHDDHVCTLFCTKCSTLAASQHLCLSMHAGQPSIAHSYQHSMSDPIHLYPTHNPRFLAHSGYKNADVINLLGRLQGGAASPQE